MGKADRMRRALVAVLISTALALACAGVAVGQRSHGSRRTSTSASARAGQGAAHEDDAEFGPVVRAYLGYLRAQQEVVDDRVSRREVNQNYYRHNSNRIRSLRQMAIRIARETGNDYLPELESVTMDELRLLFDDPPKPESLSAGATLDATFRFLGTVASGREKFYVFARLDPYEQAELQKKNAAQTTPAGASSTSQSVSGSPATTARPRRVNEP